MSVSLAVQQLTKEEKEAMLDAVSNPEQFGRGTYVVGKNFATDDYQGLCPLTLLFLKLGWISSDALGNRFEFHHQIEEAMIRGEGRFTRFYREFDRAVSRNDGEFALLSYFKEVLAT